MNANSIDRAARNIHTALLILRFLVGCFTAVRASMVSDVLEACSRKASASRMNIVIVLSSRLLVADHDMMGDAIQNSSGIQPVFLLPPASVHTHTISHAKMM